MPYGRMERTDTSTTAEPLRILIASPLEAELAARIASAEPERVRVIYEPNLLPTPRYVGDHDGELRTLNGDALARWRALLASADALFDFDWFEPHRIPVNAPRVRWVQATSAGIGERLAKTGLLETDILFTTAAGVFSVPLAEHVVLGLLYLVKDVPRLRAWQAARHWEDSTTGQLAGRRMLLIGLGHVGRAIARSCAGLGVDVWGIDPGVTAAPDGVSRLVPITDRGSALPHVDALVLACPLTTETRHLIGPAELALLPGSAVVVNVARGAVVDEPALIRALADGRLAGAVLDVFEEEPLPADSPLWGMRNVLVSAHSVGRVPAENDRIVDLFIDNLRRYLAGEPLRNVFDRARAF